MVLRAETQQETTHISFGNKHQPVICLCFGHRCRLVPRRAISYLPQVLKIVYYYWVALHIDCLPPLCTSCSCYRERGQWQPQRALDHCREMLETSLPCWPSATSAGCCPSSSRPWEMRSNTASVVIPLPALDRYFWQQFFKKRLKSCTVSV